MTVRAKYSDGTDRDVTGLALFLTNNDNSAADRRPTALVTAGDRGEAFVMARFATFTVGSQVIVLPKGLQVRRSRNVPEDNYIDTLVDAKLKKLRIAPSELCTDEAFLRRVYLDIVGLLPTREEYDRFMADTDPEQARASWSTSCSTARSSPRSGCMKWAELLQIRSSQPGQLQGDVPLLQLAAGQDRQERADGPDGAGTARRQRRHVQEPGDELLPDRDATR